MKSLKYYKDTISRLPDKFQSKADRILRLPNKSATRTLISMYMVRFDTVGTNYCNTGGTYLRSQPIDRVLSLFISNMHD